MTPAAIIERLTGWRQRMFLAGWWTTLDQEYFDAAIERLKGAADVVAARP